MHIEGGGIGEPGVVGGHRQQLSPAAHTVQRGAFVDGIKADQGSDPPDPEVEHLGAVADQQIVFQHPDVCQRRHQQHDQLPVGDEFPEGDGLLLAVHCFAHTSVRQESDDGIVLPVAFGARSGGKYAYQQGCAGFACEPAQPVAGSGGA